MQIAHYSKRLISSWWKLMQIENMQNLITKLFSCLYSHFLTLSITQLFSLFSSKKQFSLTWVMNLKIKEFNFEKAGSRAIHTENDANMFISWPHIINGATEFSMHQWNFLSWHCVELKSINFSCFKGFLWLSRSWDIDFFFRKDFYKWYHSQWNREDKNPQ